MLLAREIDHRSKNILSIVQSIVGLTQETDLAAYKAALKVRLLALSRAHTLLAGGGWHGADLNQVLNGEIAAHVDRVKLDGRPLCLPGHLIQPVAMIIHELTTNAAKYGALSASGGHVHLSWCRLNEVSGDRLSFIWSERDGPPVRAPSRIGFGTRLIDANVRQMGGTLEVAWNEAGLVCQFSLPLDNRPLLNLS